MMKSPGNPIRSLSSAAAVLLGIVVAAIAVAGFHTHVTTRGGVLIFGRRENEVAQITDEPDCSPTPFDIMAIYALYQSR